MTRRWLPLAVGVLLCSVALAAEVPPALFVPSPEPGAKEGKVEPLKVTKVAVEARIFGFIAETRMTLTFSNPHPRALAGDLYFPLPEGASVSGYALDINGQLVDGVVVDREKGQTVFEKIVRQGIDPGLVQWVKGNNFKTRVFPIPAHGSRTVSVKYVADLVHTRGGTSYALPLKFADKVPDFSVRVEVVKGAAKPEVRAGGLTNFEFGRWRDSFVAETTMRDAALTQDLIIGLPDVDKQPVLVEKGPDGEYYFCINDFPAEVKAGPGAAPKRITLLWDASGSRGKVDHRRELDLLRAYFGGLKDSKIAVDVVFFRNAAAQPKSFTVGGNCDALLVELAAVDYDGGTQMASISPAAGAAPPDFYLLFTDGISNFGKEEPTGFKVPLYILNVDSTANHGFLRQLALGTGGEYFNLNRTEDATVLASLGHPPYSFVNATVAGREGEAPAEPRPVSDTYPSTAWPVHGQFTLVGKLGADQAKLALHYGFGGRGSTQAEFTVSRAMAAEGDLIQRFWAQKKLAELEVSPKRNEAAIAALGKTFGLVTSATSLIVLDRLEQYVEHRIEPPKSLPKMRAEYAERVEKLGAQEKQTEAQRLDRIVGLWKQRVAWWQSEFKYPKDFRYKEPASRESRGGPGAILGLIVGGGAAAPAAHAPAQATEKLEATNAPRDEARQATAGEGGPAPSGNAHRAREGLRSELKDSAATEDTSHAAEPAIAIRAWDPQTPYLAALKKAAVDQLFATYMAQRKEFGTSPAFFLDCADFLSRQKQGALALQVLSNVAELDLDNAAFLRILAYRLAQIDSFELSAMLFEEVLRLRPEEPQSYRDLALVLARHAGAVQSAERRRRSLEQAQRDAQEVQSLYSRAVELLYHVVLRQWDRFDEIELVALEELNAILPKAKAAGARIPSIDPRLIQLLDFDVRIVMTWDADLTDIDLWVTEPSGEKAFYGHNRTTIGGLVSRDFTQGYGPEEYLLRRAMTGMYKVEANYYGSRQVTLAGPTTVQLDVFTNFGRPNEKRQSITLRLKEARETFHVGDIEF